MTVSQVRSDRSEGILATAARLFRERGYHATTIDDICRADGVSSAALYRHFASKDELLAAIMFRGARHLRDAVDDVDERVGTAMERLQWTIDAGGRSVINHLDFVMVTMRELDRLSEDQLARVLARSAETLERAVTAVRDVRPELSHDHVAFMLQSLSGFYTSVANYQPAVSAERVREIWVVMGTAAMLGAPNLPVDLNRAPAEDIPPRRSVSRRESILAEATSLFRRRGSAGVGMDDIGAAVGIAGPGIYRHFRNKDDLLSAIMIRAKELLAASAANALLGRTAGEVLDRLVRSYVRLAIEHPDTMAVFFAEVESVPDPLRTVVRREQRSYVDEWQALLLELAPTHDPDDARVAAYAAIGLISGYASATLRPPVNVASEILNGMTNAAIAAFVSSAP